MNEIIFSSAFQRQLKKISKQNFRLKSKIRKILNLLLADLNNPTLKLHKLSGENNWSVSVTLDIRIVLHWEKDRIFLLRIGGHDEVY